jgi:tetratricopeptide (TPR) repeat protein
MKTPGINQNPCFVNLLTGLLAATVWTFPSSTSPGFSQVSESRNSETLQQVLNRSLAQLRQRTFDAALNGFSEAIRRDDKNALAWFGRAMVRFQSAKQRFDDQTITAEETEALMQDCLAALRLDPEVYSAYRRWVGPTGDSELKEIQEQIEVLSSLEMLRGMSHLVNNEFELTFQSLDRAVDLMPNDPHRLWTRGFLHNGRDNYDAAISDFDRVVKLHQTNPTEDTLGHLGLVLEGRSIAWREKGNYQRALADSTEAMRLMPHVGSAVMHRGITHFRNNNLNQAMDDLDTAIQLDPKLALAWYHRGMIFGLRQDNARGLSDLNEAINLDPKHAESRFARGMLLVADKKSEEALADFNAAIELAPVFPAAWFNRGLLRSASNDFRGAIEDLSQFINLAAIVSINANELAMAYDHRAEAYEKAGESELATADREKSHQLTGTPVIAPMDAFLRDLNSADPATQIAAARGLREIADARAVEALCKRLKAAFETAEIDPLLVFHLEQAIIEIDDSNAIDLLISQLRYDSPIITVVADSLAKFEDPRAVDAIVSLWERRKTTPDDKWLRMMEPIIRNKIHGPRAREVLVQKLHQGDSVAAAALRRFPDAEVTQALIAVLSSSDASVKRSAIDSLAAMGKFQAGAALLPLLNDSDSAVRRQTARALGNLQEPHAVPPLIAILLAESDEKLLVDVVNALGEIGDPAALEPLQQKLRTAESPWLRKYINDAILNLTEAMARQ